MARADISHSSVERNIGPDATVTLDFALARLTSVIKNLVVYPENMMKNMNKFQGLIMSQRVLLALTQAGLSREDAYRLVQRNAMKVWEEGKDFKTELKNDPEVTKVLANEEIDEQFDLEYHTKHVDTIFQSIFRLKIIFTQNRYLKVKYFWCTIVYNISINNLSGLIYNEFV